MGDVEQISTDHQRVSTAPSGVHPIKKKKKKMYAVLKKCVFNKLQAITIGLEHSKIKKIYVCFPIAFGLLSFTG